MESDTTTGRNGLVSYQDSQGLELQGTLLRLGRHSAAFEIYNPQTVTKASEVLNDFRIIIEDQPVYFGRAVVSSIVGAGTVTVCEVTLDEAWLDVDLLALVHADHGLKRGFERFLLQWQKTWTISTDYKLLVADLQSFLNDLRLWLEQLELAVRASPAGDRTAMGREIAVELAEQVNPVLDMFFDKFEVMVAALHEDSRPAHRAYVRRLLHPIVLCAPFVYRTYHKPLGFAGDYEMVNMIIRNGSEGSSLFAKVLNGWFLHQAPARAHRNRVDYLVDRLTAEAGRSIRENRPFRVFNIGCGPACEVQRFLKDCALSTRSEFTLLDFNDETLDYARTALDEAQRLGYRAGALTLLKKGVHQLLKESAKPELNARGKYDMVYCAGLFDYLPAPVCQRLLGLMFHWLTPDGLLVATNVHPSNPRRHTMDFVMEWNLLYRDQAQMEALCPSNVAQDISVAQTDATGVNICLEIRKPVA